MCFLTSILPDLPGCFFFAKILLSGEAEIKVVLPLIFLVAGRSKIMLVSAMCWMPFLPQIMTSRSCCQCEEELALKKHKKGDCWNRT